MGEISVGVNSNEREGGEGEQRVLGGVVDVDLQGNEISRAGEGEGPDLETEFCRKEREFVEACRCFFWLFVLWIWFERGDPETVWIL